MLAQAAHATLSHVSAGLDVVWRSCMQGETDLLLATAYS